MELPVLGGAYFVATLVREVEERLRRLLAIRQPGPGMLPGIERVRKKAGIRLRVLRTGSRRGQLPQVRAELAHQLPEIIWVPLVEAPDG